MTPLQAGIRNGLPITAFAVACLIVGEWAIRAVLQ